MKKGNKMKQLTPVFDFKLVYRSEKEENTTWKFKSSAEEDINWNDIKDSLNYKEPLALVSRKYRDFETEDKYIVVDKQLLNKATTLDIEMPEYLGKIVKRVFLIENNFSDWVAWAKDVKKAGWNEPVKSTFKVIIPTV